MNRFKLILSNIQHIKKLEFEIDLSKNQLMCIVGKNGVGKTTLFRAINNLRSTDTFLKTASPNIINENSKIEYYLDDIRYEFIYNSKIRALDTKELIPIEIKSNIYVELSIPHGARFSHFQRLYEIDSSMRKKISIKDYVSPIELIIYLSKIYNSNRFEYLKEVTIKNNKYYFILKENDFYIREDYLSSGEYFVINLYKMIQAKQKLIVIDEIDISLDTSAQRNLIKELRNYCNEYKVNIVFSTHSLALIKTLENLELFYLEDNGTNITLENKSYNYIKSILFGFEGWDKYILTEDEVLNHYIEFLLAKENPMHYRYKIIYIGGGPNVVSLMKRNESELFFSKPENVICILDGDQKGKTYCAGRQIEFIPFQSIEKELLAFYEKNLNDGLPIIILNPNIKKYSDKAKALYNTLLMQNFLTKEFIFSYLNNKKPNEVNDIILKLKAFLDIVK